VWSSEAPPGGHDAGEKEAFRRVDLVRSAPGGGRHTGGRHLSRAWLQRGDLLHLEEVLGLEIELIAQAEVAARRERHAQAPSRRPLAGSAHLARDRRKHL
jgi:hypothetical protein